MPPTWRRRCQQGNSDSEAEPSVHDNGMKSRARQGAWSLTTKPTGLEVEWGGGEGRDKANAMDTTLGSLV